MDKHIYSIIGEKGRLTGSGGSDDMVATIIVRGSLTEIAETLEKMSRILKNDEFKLVGPSALVSVLDEEQLRQ